jgi:hypothetical protein
MSRGYTWQICDGCGKDIQVPIGQCDFSDTYLCEECCRGIDSDRDIMHRSHAKHSFGYQTDEQSVKSRRRGGTT